MEAAIVRRSHGERRLRLRGQRLGELRNTNRQRAEDIQPAAAVVAHFGALRQAGQSIDFAPISTPAASSATTLMPMQRVTPCGDHRPASPADLRTR